MGSRGQRALITVGACFVLLFTVGCHRTQYVGKSIGWYPPQGGQYGVEMYIETPDSGSMNSLQDKDIWIRILDTNGARLLDDKLARTRAAEVEGTVVWRTFEDLEVVISEVGGADVPDPNRPGLTQPGPRIVFDLHYHYNATSKHFERVK
jgi:hypothetical protein